MENFNLYQPPYQRIGITNLEAKLDYYELRIWQYHRCLKIFSFATLKEAKAFYKKERFNTGENEGMYYVELIHVKPLKK